MKTATVTFTAHFDDKFTDEQIKNYIGYEIGYYWELKKKDQILNRLEIDDMDITIR